MLLDLNNKIVQQCAQGMLLEGEGKTEEARGLFLKAWRESATDFERSTSAHYVARHQESVADKLKWDEISLHAALQVSDENIKAYYPSLYLNVGKGYEDLNDIDNALKNYHMALSFSDLLSDDGYGKMIRSGIMNGIERVTQH
jgi:rifampin ADP-ribosylating transferase